MVTNTLTWCYDSDCSKHFVEDFEYDREMWQFSVYWTRKAVGVKMRKNPGETEKKAKFRQIAYFSKKVPCIYANLALAQEFVGSPVAKTIDSLVIDRSTLSCKFSHRSKEQPLPTSENETICRPFEVRELQIRGPDPAKNRELRAVLNASLAAALADRCQSV